MADDLIELVAPSGTDEANHGTERYRVDNSGRVRVPREAAFYLIRYGGFVPAPAPDPAPQGAFSLPEPPPPAPQADATRRVPRSTK
jgi:hypothetical protein